MILDVAYQHQLCVWILKIGLKVGKAAMNWPLVIAKPGRLLVTMISTIVSSSPLRLALELVAAGPAVLVSVALDSDAQGAFVLSESVVNHRKVLFFSI